MNCARCTITIEPDGKKMQMPCCDTVYHPQCGIDLLCGGGYWDDIVCGCGTILHTSQGSTYDSNSYAANVEAGNVLLDTEEVKPQVKNLKNKLKEIGEAQKEFEKHLNAEHSVFEESVLPQVEAVRTLRETYITAIKQSPQFKRLNGAKISFASMYGKFHKKYPTIPLIALRNKIKCRRSIWRMRYNSAAYMLKRKFRFKR